MESQLSRRQLKKDRLYSTFVGLYILLNELNSVLQNVFRLTGQRLNNIKTFISIIIFLLLLWCILHFNKKELLLFVLWEVLAMSLYFYSWLLGASLDYLLDWAVTTLGICIPLGFLVYVIKEKNVLFKILYYFTWPTLIFLIIDLQGTTIKMYDMHFSYILLFVILFHLNHLITNEQKWLIPFIVIELLMLLMYGSRGAFVCITAFIIFKIFTNIENKKKKYGLTILFIVLTALGYYLFDNFGTILLAKLQNIGFSSRTLRLVLAGQFATHDSGRAEVWSTAIELIHEKPLTGWGISGSIERLNHPYPHNYFLDFWLSFGYILGSLFLIISLIQFKRLFTTSKGTYKDLIYIYFSMSMVMLMFSSTFFTNYNYFMLMGLLFSSKLQKNRITSNEYDRISLS